MDSQKLMLHLAIWPNIALVIIIVAALLPNPFASRWDKEFMLTPEVTPKPEDEVGTHRIDATPTDEPTQAPSQ